MTTALPGVSEVSTLFAMLFGSNTACKVSKTPLTLESSVLVATYRDNAGTPRRLLTCDLEFANSAGAALSMIPPAAANDATKAREIPENVLANLHEVLNIAVNLFTETFGGRLELADVRRVAELTPELQSALKSASPATLEIAIPRYAAGRIGLIAL